MWSMWKLFRAMQHAGNFPGYRTILNDKISPNSCVTSWQGSRLVMDLTEMLVQLSGT